MAMKLLFKKFLEWVLLLNKSYFIVAIWNYRIIPKLVKIPVHVCENCRSFYIFYQEEYQVSTKVDQLPVVYEDTETT